MAPDLDAVAVEAVPANAEAAWAAVVINYNAGAHLLDCVRSLRDDVSAGSPDIVVVDNGSTDDSLAPIERDHLARVVLAPGNIGYARAANLGTAVARAPIVAVLNPDVVVGRGTAAAMCSALAADPPIGAVGPEVVDATGAHYPSAREVPGVGTAIGHALLSHVRPENRWTRRYRQEAIDPTRARDADWVSGAAIWLRRAALDDVGGWDERYFMFFEDVDLGTRLRTNGWRVVYEPKATVVHAEGVSRRSHPVRTTIEHHRAAYRFAASHWRGTKRVLLPAVAVLLACRAAGLVLAGRVAEARLRGR